MAGSVRMESVLAPRLEQRLKLTPRMIQSMRILQLPIMALKEQIEQELAENPTLEVEENEADGPVLSDSSEPGGPEDSSAFADAPEEVVPPEPYLETSPGDEPEINIEESGQHTQDFERLDQEAENFSNVWEGAEDHPAVRHDADADPKQEMLANTPQRGESLIEDLRCQFALLSCSPAVRAAGAIVLNNLNDRGFLATPLEQLPEQGPADPRMPLTDFIQALDLVQNLDPPGVGARDIRECLLIQLERLDPQQDPEHLRPLAARIVADYFGDFERNHLPLIAKKTGLSVETIEPAIRFIARHCNPAPGLSGHTADTSPIVPDVVLVYNEARDDYDIEITDTYLPNLTISRYYREQLENKALDKTARNYLLAKIRDANWLIDAIEQRRATLRRVVREVVTVQRAFIEHGASQLKPLPMNYVARRLGIHVGTVSRTVADKYVEGPRGVFRLRDCFSAGTQTTSGEQVSYDAVREKVRELVAGEDKNAPLSDEAIVERLKALGITLARRTVAKYRDELAIPPARKRRQFRGQEQ